MKTLLSVALLALFFIPGALAVDPVEIKHPGKIEIRDLEAGKPYLTNRKYMIKRLPRELSGMKFTAGPGGGDNDFQAKIPKGSVVYVALDSEKKTAAASALRDYSGSLEKDGWRYFGTISVSDERMENLRLLVKTFTGDATVDFKGIGFVGTIIIAPAIELKGR
jgi:hypothetical protein